MSLLSVEGEQVASFRTFDGMLHAIGNRDPFSGAFVLRRGVCLTEPGVAVPVHAVRRSGARVEVRVRGA